MQIEIKNWGMRLAVTMIVLSVGASIGYAAARDWRHAIYWILAAGLTACVTF